MPEPTIAQRIVRAKRTLAEAHVPFEVPAGDELAARLASVLEVIYLVFNEGYSATAGDDWMRPQLCEDALRLGRILAGLAPREPEVHGLVALMEIQASRMRARLGPGGEPVLLLDQDRARWDRLLIRRGLAALERAEALGGALGRYALQAAIAACHARATHGRRDRLAAHRRALRRARAARAVAGRRAQPRGRGRDGVRAGARASSSSTRSPTSRRSQGYHLLPAVRGDLLAKLGRHDEARAEFERAAALTRNARERDLLLDRAARSARRRRRHDRRRRSTCACSRRATSRCSTTPPCFVDGVDARVAASLLDDPSRHVAIALDGERVVGVAFAMQRRGAGDAASSWSRDVVVVAVPPPARASAGASSTRCSSAAASLGCREAQRRGAARRRRRPAPRPPPPAASR